AFTTIAGVPDAVNDIAWSQAASRAAVLSNGVVTVLAVNPLRRIGTVATPAAGVGIDVLPGTDTAWAATRTGADLSGRRLYAIALGAATPSVARTIDVPMSDLPIRMRVTSSDLAVF